jgi:D-glycero-D-manno-heptose 1,7-bisphosphate phosphatase
MGDQQLLRRSSTWSQPCPHRLHGAWALVSGDVEAVFLDRDGVINENRTDHVKSWCEFQFLPGSREAIARLTRAGVRVFVITNQAIVNRGLAAQAMVDSVNTQMVQEIGRAGGRIEAVAYCPHRPDERCACRKPRPGLLLDLAARHRVNLSRAVVIGDAMTDIKAGLAAGCQAVLVLTGRGQDQLTNAEPCDLKGFEIALDLSMATDLILAGALAAAI